MTDTTSTKQCIATILRLGRRCRNREEGNDYCRFHGPLCEARTLLGKPCNAMVLKFRQGFIYCDHHEHISLERFVGPHEATIHEDKYPSPAGVLPRATNNNKINTTTTTMTTTVTTGTTVKTTTVTTTTTVTSAADYLASSIEKLNLSMSRNID
mmetsp:Transcript_29259/g.40200  ORF Transcript_29259/g.40200 Transcript_29259/m.40200 type:complete len:154 (-) Transcript_29259:122-583(-)